MAAISIKDLPQALPRDLDPASMARIRGGNGGWVFGWIRPYVGEALRGPAPVLNFHQTNHLYFAEQLNQQIQNVQVSNTATNAIISVAPMQLASNLALG